MVTIASAIWRRLLPLRCLARIYDKWSQRLRRELGPLLFWASAALARLTPHAGIKGNDNLFARWLHVGLQIAVENPQADSGLRNGYGPGRPHLPRP